MSYNHNLEDTLLEESSVTDMSPLALAFIYTVFYAFISVALVYPPTEAISAGLTLERHLLRWFGSERDNFVQYHVRRSAAFAVFHSLLPFVYFVSLNGVVGRNAFTHLPAATYMCVCLLCAALLLLALGTTTLVFYWYATDWRAHPIITQLTQLASRSSTPLSALIDNINEEFRDGVVGVVLLPREAANQDATNNATSSAVADDQPMRLQLGAQQHPGISTNKLYVTAHWLLHTRLYTAVLLPISELELVRVSNVENHCIGSSDSDMNAVAAAATRHHQQQPISLQSAGQWLSSGEQMIQVEFVDRQHQTVLQYRLNWTEFQLVKERISSGQLSARIEIAKHVVIAQPMREQFIDEFVECIQRNPIVRLDSTQFEQLEECLGCSVNPANVKFILRCRTDTQAQTRRQRCSQCFCRPMWCARCIARWFLAKQLERTNAARQEVFEEEEYEEDEEEHGEEGGESDSQGDTLLSQSVNSAAARWMRQSCPCPTCRTVFCLRDVSLVERAENSAVR